MRGHALDISATKSLEVIAAAPGPFVVGRNPATGLDQINFQLRPDAAAAA